MLDRPVFAVDAHGDLPDEPEPGLYYAKVPVDRVAEAARLSADGFAVVDVNVRLTLAHAVLPPLTPFAVDVAQPDDHDALLDIAGSCFRYSRFHLDPLLPDDLAHRVKREWVRSYVEGRRGVELLAARVRGRPVGFLAVLERGDERVIDLVGVDGAYQGRGVGTAVTAAFVERHAPHAARLVVGTQVANAPSLRLYQRLGFAITSAEYVLHRHVG